MDEETDSNEVMLLAIRNRRLARAAALRVLYALDSVGQLDSETVCRTIELVAAPVGEGEFESLSDSVNFFQVMIDGTLRELLEIDRLIQQSSERWTLPRIARIDRNILRLAVYEIMLCKDTPISVIINEAVEIAKQYGAPDAASFVNGVLDHAARSIRGIDPLVKVAS